MPATSSGSIRMRTAEIGKNGHCLRDVTGLQIGRAAEIVHVIPKVPGERPGSIQRFDGLAIIAVEHVCVAHNQPGQGSGVFLGVGASECFHAGISRGSAVPQQLLRHRTQSRGSNKCLAQAANTRRH